MDVFYINLVIITIHFLLFTILISTYLTWNNFFIMLLGIEMAVLCLTYLYIIFAGLLDDIYYYLMIFSILIVSSVEAVIGLLLLINFMNTRH